MFWDVVWNQTAYKYNSVYTKQINAMVFYQHSFPIEIVARSEKLAVVAMAFLTPVIQKSNSFETISIKLKSCVNEVKRKPYHNNMQI